MRALYPKLTQLATLGLLLVVLAAKPANAQQIIKDDSYNDPEFVKFKMQLVEAVLKRDTTLLFALVDDRVLVSDEPCGQIPLNCFKDIFRGVPASVNPAWDDMYRAISFGFSENHIRQNMPGYAHKGEVVFQAPSYQSRVPDNNKQLLVLGQMVNIRQSPDVHAPVVDRVTFKKLDYNDPLTSSSVTAYNRVNGKMWYEVLLADGSKGYIIEDYVSASLQREISIKKVDGTFKIISFYQRAQPGC